MQILLSRSPAGPGRTGKQEQEQISPNLVQAFFPSSVEYELLITQRKEKSYMIDIKLNCRIVEFHPLFSFLGAN